NEGELLPVLRGTLGNAKAVALREWHLQRFAAEFLAIDDLHRSLVVHAGVAGHLASSDFKQKLLACGRRLTRRGGEAQSQASEHAQEKRETSSGHGWHPREKRMVAPNWSEAI